MTTRALIAAALLALAPAGGRAQPAVAATLAPVAVEAFHATHADAPVWADDANYQALLEALAALEAEGLNPQHYHLAELRALSGDAEARDRLATDAWFSAAAHMLYGKLDPETVEPDWTAARREADLGAVLTRALADGTVQDSLAALAPAHPDYAALKSELARLRGIAAEPVLAVPDGPTLRQGDSGPRVEALQRRLVQLGLMGEGEATGAFDAATSAAVAAFQFEADLDDDAVVGPATLRTLNRDPQAMIDQVRVNMERWRWLPEDLGRRHVRVNIAGFTVATWQDGELQRTHLAIVGKTYRKTPVFSDRIEYIIFNPWWETPPSIARADKLPLFRKNPGEVERLGFQVLDGSGARVNPASIDWASLSASRFPYRLRQAPGPLNALGQVKIMFPNAHNVYLHDTPSRGLFAEQQRAFSSGCIRTQDPLALAAWLLEETEGWDRARIDAAVATGRETRVDLAAPVPVHVLYFTAVSDQDGAVRYLDDIYERDGAVLAGLNEDAVS